MESEEQLFIYFERWCTYCYIISSKTFSVRLFTLFDGGENASRSSFHAHIHLAQQVIKHGGLARRSAFGFESCVRFIGKKAHRSKHIRAQIFYWIDLRTIMHIHPVNPPTVTTTNVSLFFMKTFDCYIAYSRKLNVWIVALIRIKQCLMNKTYQMQSILIDVTFIYD